MRFWLVLLTPFLSGCAMPYIRDTGNQVTVTCVMANCITLIQELEEEGKSVRITCVMARCGPSQRKKTTNE